MNRYRILSTLESTAERRVDLVRDRWTGQTVVLKSEEISSAIREARALLAMPEGIGPKLLDVQWTKFGLALILEHLQGDTLETAGQRIPPARIPEFVLAICHGLAQVHRTGWVHADLKPHHILLTKDNGSLAVRLLDFGFALDLFGDVSEQTIGGTPPYLAPELQKGWLFDGRADQYSLGIVLREVFPRLEEDHTWARVIERLTDEIPAQRYPDSVALGKRLSRSFGVVATSDRLPRFGAGPMRGREALLAAFVDRIRKKPTSRILVQARPGTGLSRFLCEVVLATATKRCAPTRMIDLGRICSHRMAVQVREYLERPESHREAIVLGIGDPSPGLHWVPEHAQTILNSLIRKGAWERINLPPLDLESMREIVATCLGAKDESSDELGRMLRDLAEGDLHGAAIGFRNFVEHSGREEGLSWRLNLRKLRRCSRPAASYPPSLDQVAPSLARALMALARAGQSFSEDLGAQLLQEFHSGTTLTDVKGHGFLVEDGPHRLQFVTRTFRQEALTHVPDRAADIDRCICQSEPDVERLDEVLHYCNLALRIGERSKAVAWLGQALSSADVQRRYNDIVRVLAFPDPVPARWTYSFVLRRIARLHSLLGPSWSEGRVFRIAGAGLRALSAEIGTKLLERAASGRDDSEALDALLLLADGAAKGSESPDFVRYRKSILRHARGNKGAEGVLRSLEARILYSSGRTREARTLAHRASRLLRGSGLLHEALNLQLVAILESATDPMRAAKMMSDALAATTDPELTAQLRHNLALMYARAGMLREAAECADRGIHEVIGRVSLTRLANLRIQRAWSWADLDRIDPAGREAQWLLPLAVVRFAPQRLIPVRLLVGFCDMFLGRSREAVRQIAQAMAATDQGTVGLRWDCLRFFADAVLDFEAWDLVAAYRERIPEPYDGNDALSRATTARTCALLLQEQKETVEARKVLERCLPVAQTLSFRLARARYFHHLGLVYAAEATGSGNPESARLASKLFEEELKALPGQGHGYYRIHALLSLGSILLRDERMLAMHAYSQAVTLARRIQSPWLLARCLEARTEARTRSI